MLTFASQLPVRLDITKWSGRYLLSLFKQRRGWGEAFTICSAIIIWNQTRLGDIKTEDVAVEALDSVKNVPPDANQIRPGIFRIENRCAEIVRDIVSRKWGYYDSELAFRFVTLAIEELAAIAEYIEYVEYEDDDNGPGWTCISDEAVIALDYICKDNPVGFIEGLIEDIYQAIYGDEEPDSPVDRGRETIYWKNGQFNLDDRHFAQLQRIDEFYEMGESVLLDLMINDYWLSLEDSHSLYIFERKS